MTEFRPGSFQMLPVVIKNLLIVNTLVYLAQWSLKLPIFDDAFALHTWQSQLFKPWQFFTYMFLHGSWWHLAGNMFALWMFGATLENVWGPGRFLAFYIACGLGGALCHMIVLYFENQSMINEFYSASISEQNEYLALFTRALNRPTIGASGAVFGCIAAFGYMFPNDVIYWRMLVPIKVKWIVLMYIGGELFLQFQNSPGDAVAHTAHLGGAVVGLLLAYFWNKNNRRSIY
jgi:membrane associated rhomboid family serine protease